MKKDWLCLELKINTATRTNQIAEELSRHRLAPATTSHILQMLTATDHQTNLNLQPINQEIVTQC